VAVAGASQRGMVGSIELAAASRPAQSWTILDSRWRSRLIAGDDEGDDPSYPGGIGAIPCATV
jgi:hypothetical protein